jgi:uncharacterized membrane protein
MNALTVLIVVSTVCAALIGGVFFAFSVFVMRALASTPPALGVLAMQRINITVINPLFLGVFLGTAPLLGITAFFAQGNAQAFAWVMAACAIYLFGSVGVTLAFNVPRNNRLASLEPTSAQAAAYWPTYVREWLGWNHVRCIASLAAAACAAVAIAP